MSKELVIGSSRHEAKVAVLEDDQLVEIYFQRANEYSLAGSIHKGRVTRVLPGMQSAFVDLGLERDTFLYVSDFFEEHPDIDTVPEEKVSRGPRQDQRRDRSAEREIQSPEGGRPAAHEAAGAGSPTEGVQLIPATGPEQQPEAAADAGHERRGRRSRRRRSRGRGFPENKYAQPPASDETTQQSTEEEEPEEEAAEEPAADVVVLPGESLAKYRHAGAADTGQNGTGEEGQETTGPTDIQEEPISAVDLAEIAPEQVASTPATPAPRPETRPRDLRYDDFAIHVVSDLDEEAIDAAEARAEEIAEIVEAQAQRFEEAEAVSDTEPEVEVEFVDDDANEAVVVIEAEPETGEADSSTAAESAPQHAVEEGTQTGTEERAEGEPDSSAQTEKPELQSATVREQGGRYMHRMSRRMRRRRGRGNATGTPGDNAGPTTATALAPETRAEEAKPEREDHEAKAERLPSITELLKPGQEIIVQIAKEPLGQKGARITSHVALPGRYVVYMPSVEHLGVSRKIASDEERYRLKKILQAHRVGTTGGFIIRTAGEGRTEDEIAADMNFLYNLWLDIRQKAEKRPAPALLHHDLDVVQRILRDQLTDEYKAIWADNEEMYENVLRFVQRFQPSLVSRVKMYTRKAPIFDAFNITQELEKALRPKVWLKSGGYIVINQTEALVAIDVNTGKFVGKSNRLEDTIVKTNTEAVKEIVRQIRLRDLGGIIVVDFIDMDERKNRQKVMQALEEAMRADKAPYKILQFNDFGLVAITRKRVKQSLERTLCAPCPYCEGAGYVKSVQTVISEMLVEAQKIAAAVEGNVVLRCNPEVAKVLKSKDNQYLEELEETLGRPVLVTGDVQLHLEKFDLG
jgi:ribonuclease G